MKSRTELECEIDRLSALPDDILTHKIFSHLSLTDIIRTSLLSRRWRSLWKEIRHLNFSEEFFQSLNLSSRRWPFVESAQQKAKYINDIIDNILLLHSGHIESFSFHPYLLQLKVFRALRVDQWVHRAALKEVKRMSLHLHHVKFGRCPSLFTCFLLRDLELEGFRFISQFPTKFCGFRSLQSLYLSNLYDLTSEGLKQLIESCPLLHKVVLAHCWGLIDLKIQAPNLNSLNVIDCADTKSLTVDCPQLVELEIASCYSLIEFKIYSSVLVHDLHASDVQTPGKHPMLNSLRKLSMKSCPRISDLTLLTILGCFCNLEEVHIKNSIGQIYEKDNSEQIGAKGEVVADLTFPTLKKAYVYISGVFKKEEAVILASLLNHAPSLNTMTVTLPKCSENIHKKEFINKVMDLQQIYEKVDISIKFYDKIYRLSDRKTRSCFCKRTYGF